MTNTIPFFVQKFLNADSPDLEAGIKPPSPMTGSITAQAICSGLKDTSL